MRFFKQYNTQTTLVVCVLLYLLPTIVQAQPDTLWISLLGEGGTPMSVIQTFDGSFAIGTADWNRDPDRRDTDYCLIKTDSAGVLEWQEFYTLDPDTLFQVERCFKIVQLSDSSYVLVGSGPGGPGAMIVRVAPNGEMIFSRFYPDDVFSSFTDCVLSDDEDLVVVSYGLAGKLDADNGDIIWRNSYMFQGSGIVYDLAHTYDDGYLLTGRISSIGAGGADMYAVKIDGNGEVEWRNAYGTEYAETALDAVQTADGGFCLSGKSSNEEHRNIGMVVRIDAAGEEIWRNIFNGDDDGVVLRDIVALIETPDSGYAIARNGSRDITRLGRLNSEGELLWLSEYFVVGGHGPTAFSLLLMEDFGYLQGGFASGIGDWLVRTEPDSLSVIAWNLQSAEDVHDFGEVAMDSTQVWDMTLTNEADYPVYIRSITSDSVAFSVEFEEVLALEAGEETTVPVSFTPNDSREYTGTLLVHTKFRDLMIELSGTGVPLSAPEESNIPLEFALDPVYPNPFNGTVKFEYTLPEAAEIKLSIFDVTGREVVVLFEGVQKTGRHSSVWNSEGFAAGSYVLNLDSASEVRTQKLTLIK